MILKDHPVASRYSAAKATPRIYLSAGLRCPRRRSSRGEEHAGREWPESPHPAQEAAMTQAEPADQPPSPCRQDKKRSLVVSLRRPALLPPRWAA